MDWLTNFFMNSAGGLTGLPPGDAGLLPPPPGDEVFNSLSSPGGLPQQPGAGFAAPGGPPAVPGLIPKPPMPGFSGTTSYNPTTAGAGGPGGSPEAPMPGFTAPLPSIGEVLAPGQGGGGPMAGTGGLPQPSQAPQVPQAHPVQQADQGQKVAGGLAGLANTLRGVQAPHSDVVKPSTPHGPPVQHIQSGSISQLLAQLYPGLVNRVPLASQTLGQAVGTGRY